MTSEEYSPILAITATPTRLTNPSADKAASPYPQEGLTLPHDYDLPNTGFLRIRDVLRFIPVSRSHFWAGVKLGVYPTPVKLGPGVTAWRAEDIRDWIDSIPSS